MRLLLDTHAWLRAARSPTQLAQGVAEEIADAEVVTLSVASVWEAAIKVASGKLDIDGGVRALVDHTAGTMRVKLLPVTVEHALQAAALPRHHGDPFDRMIVALARVEGLVVVTADAQIQRYEVSVLWGRS